MEKIRVVGAEDIDSISLTLTSVQVSEKDGAYFAEGQYFPKCSMIKALNGCSFSTCKGSAKNFMVQLRLVILSRNLKKTFAVYVQSKLYNAALSSKELLKRFNVTREQSLTARTKSLKLCIYFSWVITSYYQRGLENCSSTKNKEQKT